MSTSSVGRHFPGVSSNVSTKASLDNGNPGQRLGQMMAGQQSQVSSASACGVPPSASVPATVNDSRSPFQRVPIHAVAANTALMHTTAATNGVTTNTTSFPMGYNSLHLQMQAAANGVLGGTSAPGGVSLPHLLMNPGMIPPLTASGPFPGVFASATPLAPNPAQTSGVNKIPVPYIFMNQKLRSGKWIPEEEAYADLLIELFEKGLISECDNGTTLRSFLSKKLHCAPMRISKKYAGKGIGKKVFLTKMNVRSFQEMSISEISAIDARLREIEGKFYKSVLAESQQSPHEAAAIVVALSSRMTNHSPHMFPGLVPLFPALRFAPGLPHVLPASIAVSHHHGALAGMAMATNPVAVLQQPPASAIFAPRCIHPPHGISAGMQRPAVTMLPSAATTSTATVPQTTPRIPANIPAPSIEVESVANANKINPEEITALSTMTTKPVVIDFSPPSNNSSANQTDTHASQLQESYLKALQQIDNVTCMSLDPQTKQENPTKKLLKQESVSRHLNPSGFFTDNKTQQETTDNGKDTQGRQENIKEDETAPVPVKFESPSRQGIQVSGASMPAVPQVEEKTCIPHNETMSVSTSAPKQLYVPKVKNEDTSLSRQIGNSLQVNTETAEPEITRPAVGSGAISHLAKTIPLHQQYEDHSTSTSKSQEISPGHQQKNFQTDSMITGVYAPQIQYFANSDLPDLLSGFGKVTSESETDLRQRSALAQGQSPPDPQDKSSSVLLLESKVLHSSSSLASFSSSVSDEMGEDLDADLDDDLHCFLGKDLRSFNDEANLRGWETELSKTQKMVATVGSAPTVRLRQGSPGMASSLLERQARKVPTRTTQVFPTLVSSAFIPADSYMLFAQESFDAASQHSAYLPHPTGSEPGNILPFVVPMDSTDSFLGQFSYDELISATRRDQLQSSIKRKRDSRTTLATARTTPTSQSCGEGEGSSICSVNSIGQLNIRSRSPSRQRVPHLQQGNNIELESINTSSSTNRGTVATTSWSLSSPSPSQLSSIRMFSPTSGANVMGSHITDGNFEMTGGEGAESSSSSDGGFRNYGAGEGSGSVNIVSGSEPSSSDVGSFRGGSSGSGSATAFDEASNETDGNGGSEGNGSNDFSDDCNSEQSCQLKKPRITAYCLIQND